MNKYSLVSIAVVSSIMLSGCGSNSDSTPAIGEALTQATENVDFDFDLSALLDKVVAPGETTDGQSLLNDALILSDAASLMTGTMVVENLDSSQSEIHNWTVNLDENDLSNVTSFKSLVLEPRNWYQ